MDYRKVTKIFLDYFVERGHLLLENVSLIPKELDPSALFTSSGMHPLKLYFTGQEKLPSKKLCSNQKCFRTGDIDNVGKNRRHLTFFFMLGNWSIGDYFKEKAIEYAYDLLINHYKLNKDKIWVTVFEGDEEVPKDKESKEIWIKIGIPRERIVELPSSENFWSFGPIGPCGPCTEIHYDIGKELGCGKETCKPGCDCDRYLEIFNLVFMTHNKTKKGLEPLPFKNVDTGLGLARLAMVLQNKKSVFETDLFEPLIKLIEEYSGKNIEEKRKEISIIAEHMRAVIFLIADGVIPSKMDRGYVLRRVLRRIIRYCNKLNINKEQILNLAKQASDIYISEYPHLKNLKLEIIEKEYDKFIMALKNGLDKFKEMIAVYKKQNKNIISGKDVFLLYESFGFPIELTKELALEQGLNIDEKGYEESFKKHKQISRVSMEKEFKGGLVDKSKETIKLHTATHLLHQTLKDVLGQHVNQRGSNITTKRLRFDFNYDKKLTKEQIEKVQEIVNNKIQQELPVKIEKMTFEQAKKSGAIALFEEKYDKEVTVYSIGDYSKEVCGGPHVKDTSELGKFKILKEKGIAEGIRRIKAVLE